LRETYKILVVNHQRKILSKIRESNVEKLLHKETMKVQAGNETCSHPPININQAVLKLRAVLYYKICLFPDWRILSNKRNL
jgi:hypothetical protein